MYKLFSLRVPEVVVLKKHVLVMSFIGEEGRPAPKLKDAVEHMTKAQVQSAYNQVVDMMVSFFLFLRGGGWVLECRDLKGKANGN